jgi:3-methyladenine DNA glycosylase AlkD
MDNSLLVKVTRLLKKSADKKTQTSFQRFFKEKVKYHGVKAALVTEIAEEYAGEIKNKSKGEVFALSEKLLQSGFCEEAWMAANWVGHFTNNFEKEDIEIFERWIDKYIDNWAKCDTFCGRVVASLIEKYPLLIGELNNWAQSDNLWLRRAAAVSLIAPARKGRFLKEIFEICDLLLTDKEDLVQKGYGWLLREAGKKHLNEVFDYIIYNKARMPRTSLRYAIEKMDKDMRAKAMAR